jgi:hypothetical protein
MVVHQFVLAIEQLLVSSQPGIRNRNRFQLRIYLKVVLRVILRTELETM